MLPILILADQLAHVLAAGALAPLAYLFIHERLKGVGQGNVHRAHGVSLGCLAKFGKAITADAMNVMQDHENTDWKHEVPAPIRATV